MHLTQKRRIAKHYAQAAFESGADQGLLEAVLKDTQILQEVSATHSHFVKTLSAANLKEKEILDRVKKVAKIMKLQDLTANLLAVMGVNRRLFLLPDVCTALQKMILADQGIVVANITTASTLSSKQSKALQAAIRSGFSKVMSITDIQLNQTTNPEILGGLRVQVGSVMVDASVHTKLQRLQRTIRGN